MASSSTKISIGCIPKGIYTMKDTEAEAQVHELQSTLSVTHVWTSNDRGMYVCLDHYAHQHFNPTAFC